MKLFVQQVSKHRRVVESEWSQSIKLEEIRSSILIFHAEVEHYTSDTYTGLPAYLWSLDQTRIYFSHKSQKAWSCRTIILSIDVSWSSSASAVAVYCWTYVSNDDHSAMPSARIQLLPVRILHSSIVTPLSPSGVPH